MRCPLCLTASEGERSCPSPDHLRSRSSVFRVRLQRRMIVRTMTLKVGATFPRLGLTLAPLAAFLSNALGGCLCPTPNFVLMGCGAFPLVFCASHNGLWNAGGLSAEKLVLAALADLTTLGESGPLSEPSSSGCDCWSMAEASTKPAGHFTPWDTLNSGKEG